VSVNVNNLLENEKKAHHVLLQRMTGELTKMTACTVNGRNDRIE
jgi:hypothetical protein